MDVRMDNSSLKYFPHKAYNIFLPILAVISVAIHIGWVYLLSQKVISGAVITFVMAVVGTYACASLYLSSRVCLTFGAKEIVIRDKHNMSQSIPWEQFRYGYYARSYKGFTFLVLSKTSLNEHQLKNLANQSANSSRVCIDNTVVFYLNHSRDASVVEKCVNEHVSLEH